MPRFRVQTRMAYGGGDAVDAFKWSNLWYINASNVMGAAALGADLWVSVLQAAHSEYAYCYEVYASDLLEETVSFTTEAIAPGDQRGNVSGGTTVNLYNPNIVNRWDLLVAGGFPSRKFMRWGLDEEHVEPGGRSVTASAWATAIQTAMSDAIAFEGIVDESGNGFSGVTDHGLVTRRLAKLARAGLPSPPSLG